MLFFLFFFFSASRREGKPISWLIYTQFAEAEANVRRIRLHTLLNWDTRSAQRSLSLHPDSLYGLTCSEGKSFPEIGWTEGKGREEGDVIQCEVWSERERRRRRRALIQLQWNNVEGQLKIHRIAVGRPEEGVNFNCIRRPRRPALWSLAHSTLCLYTHTAQCEQCALLSGK